MLLLGQILDAVFSPLARAIDLHRAPRRMALAQAAGLPNPSVDEYGSVFATDRALTIAISSGGKRRAHIVTVRGLAPGLRVARARLGSRLRGALAASDVQVGDPAFDAAVVLELGSPGLRCLFDANTRAQVRAVFDAGFEVRIAHGELVARLVRPVWRRSDAVARALRGLVDLAHRLEEPTDAAARLARLATGDPFGTIRRRALRTLVELAPQDPSTREVLRAATRDPEAGIRLDAAWSLAEEGEPVLQALAADAQADDAIAAEAIDALGAGFALADARSVLERAVADGRVRTAVAAIAVVARGGEAEAPGVAVLLSRKEDAIAAAAARALAAIGGVASVPELKAAEARGGDVRRDAREAIAAIQSRLTGATPGQISLTGGVAGQVSVVDSADGRVSFRPEE